MQPAELGPYTLRRRTGSLAEGAAVLGKDLDAVPVTAVLADANRTAKRKGATTAFGDMKPRPVDWFTFETGDGKVRDWYPQGLTSASDGGSGRDAFIVSWYWKPKEPKTKRRGVRLSFLDPATARYRHVLLVTATPDGKYTPVNIHAGGIAWYGDLLYVADTTNGFRVFDLGRILDLHSAQKDSGDPERFGREKDRFHAYGYRYLMPQVDSWKLKTPGARFSFASIDRSHSPDLLISGEYIDKPGAVGRAARWALDADGTLRSDDGLATPMDVHRAPAFKIQGGLTFEDRWYLSQAGTGAVRGKLLTGDDGKPMNVRSFPFGPEDLTVWREKKTLWSVTEFPGRRAIYGVPL